MIIRNAITDKVAAAVELEARAGLVRSGDGLSMTRSTDSASRNIAF
jgi:hypothetical protein